MSSIITSSYKSPVGELILGVYENKLCLADWKYRKMRDAIDARLARHLATDFAPGTHDLLDEAARQLHDYFNKSLEKFDLPLLLAGTSFQISVWEELQNIPYGTTCSYISLSRKLKNEKAIRAVASANGANAISIIVPCHRIIGADGSMTGYAGGIKAKKKLLEHEGVNLHNGQQLLF